MFNENTRILIFSYLHLKHSVTNINIYMKTNAASMQYIGFLLPSLSNGKFHHSFIKLFHLWSAHKHEVVKRVLLGDCRREKSYLGRHFYPHYFFGCVIVAMKGVISSVCHALLRLI